MSSVPQNLCVLNARFDFLIDESAIYAISKHCYSEIAYGEIGRLILGHARNDPLVSSA